MERSNKISDIYLAAKKLVKQNDSEKMSVATTKRLEVQVEDIDGGRLAHVYAISWEESINHLVSKLQSMDLKELTVVILCQNSNHCKWLQVMLEERDVNNLLLCHNSDDIGTIKSCWPYLFNQKILIITTDLIAQLQLGDKTIDLLVLDNIADTEFHTLSKDILYLSHRRFENENGNFITTCPEPKTLEVSPKLELKKTEKNSSWYNSICGIMVFGQWPFLYCNYITGVAGMSMKIRNSMMKHFAIEKARKEQRCAWPHLAYGHSMIMIGHEKCGKTWSFIPILSQRIYNAIKGGNLEWAGPICISVVVNMSEGKTLAKIMREMLDFCSTDGGNVTKVVTLFDNSSIKEVSKILCRPCGILITTVELLLQLQQFEKPGFLIFDPMHLRCIVLDNLDELRRTNRMKFMTLINWLVNKFKFEKDQTQLIITSRLWMEGVMRTLPNVIIIFEDGLEACAYRGIELNLEFVSATDHDEGITLLKTLTHCNLKMERIVIVCHTNYESRHLSELLKAQNIPHIHFVSPNETIEKKIQNENGIIIAKDDMLPNLKCGYIDLLICYTLTNSWHRYKARFNLFYTNCKSLDERPGKALMFFNEMATEQAWLFCDFILKHDLPMQEEWFKHLFNFRLQKEIIQPQYNINLCTQLLSYGNCSRRSCRFRHRLLAKEAQIPSYLPSGGKIYFNIMDCISPTNLVVRPIASRKKHQPKVYQNINMPNGVHVYYRQEVNQIPLLNPSIGDVCILEVDKCYQRAVIIGVDSDEVIGVRLLDWDGRYMEVFKTGLYQCHEHFSTQMAQAIELRLTGIMPYSMDRLWTTAESRYIRHRFCKFSTDHLYSANIDFAFNNILFVNTIYSKNGEDLREILLNRMYAYDDEFVRSRFIDMALKAV